MSDSEDDVPLINLKGKSRKIKEDDESSPVKEIPKPTEVEKPKEIVIKNEEQEPGVKDLPKDEKKIATTPTAGIKKEDKPASTPKSSSEKVNEKVSTTNKKQVSSSPSLPPKEQKSNKDGKQQNGSASKNNSENSSQEPSQKTNVLKRKRDEAVIPSKPPKKAKKAKEESESESESSSDDSSSEESSDDSESESSASESESSDDSESESSSSSSSSSEEDDDLPLTELAKKKKAPAKKKTATPSKSTKKVETKSSKSTKSKSSSKTTSKKKKKEEEEEESGKKKKKKGSKEDEEPEYKWWLEPPLPEGKKWRTLEHHGVLFPPEYKPHGIPLIYDGEEIVLAPEQEELATYFSMYLESDHMKKPQFSKNFFQEFLGVLNPKGKKKHKIADFKKCDFTKIREHLLKEKEARKNRDSEEKKKEKKEKQEIQDKYGFAIVDGHKEKVGNFRVEPPGLFLGRGDHPKAGMLKKRVYPEDVTLNLGKKAPVPPCPIEGHKWGKIIHNDEVTWLAMWKDSINDSFKYVWLAPSSRIKGEADLRKFETARKLKDHIDEIRATYTKELKSKDERIRQRATALYVIDHLALRVGNEKDSDEQADTVGCCSLRVEHIKLTDPNVVEFDFLGKDSMRYQNRVEVDELVYKNLKSFMKGKEKGDELFDLLTTTALNNHLKSVMDGLTAKVFRTFNASVCLQTELKKTENSDKKKRSMEEEMLNFTRANREVAILCNHQRTVSKNFGEQIEKIDEKIKELKDQVTELKEHLSDVKKGKPSKKRKREDDDEGNDKKKARLSDDPEKLTKQIQKVKDRIKVWEAKKTEKDETKTVSLSTSKINYLDPRISVAWAKRVGAPIEKVFSKALRLKFPWAMYAEKDFEF